MHFCSLGYRCQIGTIMKNIGMKSVSYPFDWIVSDLLIKIDIINNNFENFLDINNYEYVEQGEVYNIIDNNKNLVANENYSYNKFYGNNNDGLYHLKIGLNHYDLKNTENYDYFKRCINRFNNLLQLSDKKIFLYMNPLISYDKLDETINSYNIFTDYFNKITTNFVIIYFVLLKTNNDIGSYDIYNNNKNKLILIINCNKNFIDYENFYPEKGNNELTLMENLLKDIINNKIEINFN